MHAEQHTGTNRGSSHWLTFYQQLHFFLLNKKKEKRYWVNGWLTSDYRLAAAICSKPQSQMARLLWSEFRAGAALTAAKQALYSSLLWCSLKGTEHGRNTLATRHFLIFLMLAAWEDVLHSQICTYQYGKSQAESAVYCFVPCAAKSNIWAPPGVGSTVQMGIRFNSWTSFLWILCILSHREVCVWRSAGRRASNGLIAILLLVSVAAKLSVEIKLYQYLSSSQEPSHSSECL